MKIGPIAPSIVATNPLKPLRIRTAHQRQTVVFSKSRPIPMQHEPLEYTLDFPVLGTSASNSRAVIQQLLELGQNAEWQRAGIYLTCREDGVLDANDGWYTLQGVDVPELSQAAGWANAQLDVLLRARRALDIGSYVDAKAVPNDYGLVGTPMAAYPQGLAAGFPAATWSLAASDGSTISIVENPTTVLRAALTDPNSTMTLGRCAVIDSGVAYANPIEVFHEDHRFLGSYVQLQNGLVRYSILLAGGGQPLVEFWSGSAWVSAGNMTVQLYNGVTYYPAPVQSALVLSISPEEVTWEERRWDTARQGLVRLVCRLRRGSRIIEMQMIAASGMAPTGASAVALTNCGVTATAATADGSAAVGTGIASSTVGWLYLTQTGAAASVASTTYSSGIFAAAGTVSRFGLLASPNDAMFTSLATASAFVQRWSAYNRSRIRQRILVG